MLDKIANFISGGFTNGLMDTIKEYFPPSMTDAERMRLELAIKQFEHEKQVEANKVLAESEKSLNERIAQYEGTASDLKSLPLIGSIVLFLRGLQRPLIGYATVYADYMWFSGQWTNLTEQQESALWVINLLVLSFLFGERAISNLSPVIEKVMAGKK